MEQLITPSRRIVSVDVLRGLIMMIMAIDHTRDFLHIEAFRGDPLNIGDHNPALFFTRWITHYCAPLFVFLAGVSAFLYGRGKSRAALSGFLISRGVWLIFVELVVMTLIMTADIGYHTLFLGVIWAAGWSMIFLGLLVRTSYRLILILGCLLFFGHNLFDLLVAPSMTPSGAILGVFFTSRGMMLPITAGHFAFCSYAILPWTGIMLLGYCTGKVFDWPEGRRKPFLVNLGSAVLLLFIILRFVNFYGDPVPWKGYAGFFDNFLSFINTTKYPPSLLYSCMTIGPGLILLAVFEHAQGRVARVLTVYGRVPFFYYVTHFLLIRVASLVLFYASGYTAKDADTFFFKYRPVDMGLPLWAVYLCWLGVLLVLYFPCKWFGEYKQRHKEKAWLSYL